MTPVSAPRGGAAARSFRTSQLVRFHCGTVAPQVAASDAAQESGT